MNTLVIHGTGLHLGYLGCYGCDWVDTPNLNRLAAEGIVFDQHLADCPLLRPEAGSRTCFTGRYSFPVPQGDASSPLDVWLPEILKAKRIAARFLDYRLETEDFPAGICDALDVFSDSERSLLWVDWPSLAPPWNVSEDYLESYFAATSAETDQDESEALEPWLDPPTGPLDLSGADLERLQNTYAAVITAFDDRLGMVLDELRERGLLDDLLICVTASCGLALGEHGYVGEHRAWLHEEIVHVPLLLRLPAAGEAGLRVSALTQPLDLLPTILEALELPVPTVDGRSLLPVVQGQPGRERAFSALDIGYSVEWAIRTAGWALLVPLSAPPQDEPRAPQLYVKPDDRWEVNDVGQHHPELVEELEKILRNVGEKRI
jgi:arylsulfatase A-like enzyme